MKDAIKSLLAAAALVPLSYVGINEAVYLSERYVSNFMDEIILGHEHACRDSLRTINNFDTSAGHVLFPIGRKGTKDFYDANCR